MLGLCVLACSARPEPIRVAKIVIDVPAAADADTASRETLRQHVRDQVDASSRSSFVKKRADATHVLKVRVESVTEVPDFAAQHGDEPPPLGPAVRPVLIELRPVGGGNTISAIGRGDAKQSLWQGAQGGFDDGWRVFQAQRELAVQKEESIIEALVADDVRIRDFAVQLVGERKLLSALPKLLECLRIETHPQVVLRIVGSLVVLGDPSAVGPMIDLTYERRPDFVLQIIFAVATIGGRKAEGFLVTMAGGHPDPRVQEGAKQALRELKR